LRYEYGHIKIGWTPLETAVSRHIASTRYPNTADEQDFIMLDASPVIDNSELSLRSPYGWLRPVRFAAAAGRVNEIFVYPRGAGDPTAEAIRASFKTGQRAELGGGGVLCTTVFFVKAAEWSVEIR